MTRGAAIEWINNLTETMKLETSEYLPHPEYKDEVYEAIDMAIEALKAIDDIKAEIEAEIELKSNLGDYNDYVRLGLQSALEIIDEHIGKENE